MLPAAPGFVRKVKPLVRLSERETAAYCVLRGIDYQVEECPMAAGNKHLRYKALLNELEEQSPGSKAAFLFGFVERGHDRFAATADDERAELVVVRVLRSADARGRPTARSQCARSADCVSARASRPSNESTPIPGGPVGEAVPVTRRFSAR